MVACVPGFAVHVAVRPVVERARPCPGRGAAADITVILDQAKLVKLPDRVATLVIGNPLIADASIQSGGQHGDHRQGLRRDQHHRARPRGNVLMDKSIEVRRAARRVVVVYRGVERETYSCTPKCERRITLGDGRRLFRCRHRRDGRAQRARARAAPAAPK